MKFYDGIFFYIAFNLFAGGFLSEPAVCSGAKRFRAKNGSVAKKHSRIESAINFTKP